MFLSRNTGFEIMQMKNVTEYFKIRYLFTRLNGWLYFYLKCLIKEIKKRN